MTKSAYNLELQSEWHAKWWNNAFKCGVIITIGTSQT